MSTRRVTMLVRNTIADDNRVLKEAAALTQAGYRVTLVGMQGEGLPADLSLDGVRLLRVAEDAAVRRALRRRWEQGPTILAPAYIAAYKAAGLMQPLTYLAEFNRAVAKHEAELAADIWYAHDLNTLPTALRLRAKYGGAVVYDSHEYWLDCNSTYTPFAKFIWTWLQRRLIGKADRVITVSESIARRLAEDYGIAVPAVVLNTPVDQAPPPPAQRLAERFGMPGAFVFVYVGRLTRQRGYEQILAALAQVPGAAVVCFGNGPASYRESLVHHAAELGVADRFKLAGSVPTTEIQAAIAGADAGILAVQRGAVSYDFALPSKLFEYVFAGLPVVASDIVEVARVVNEFDLGILVDERSAESIADGMRRMMTGREAIRGADWVERRRRFSERYDWRRHQEVLVRLVDQLVGGAVRQEPM